MNNQKKDKLPMSTVNEIRCKLSQYGINPIEIWNTSKGNLFTLRLRTTYHVKLSEGKGITCEYALASAYGELMERLQNFCISGFHFNINTEKISQEKFLLKNPNFFDQFFSNNLFDFEFKSNSPEDKLKELQNIINAQNKEIGLMPYYSVKQKKIVKLPYEILRTIYSSNGMCAGNTIAEALVQGLSEILERYCSIYIYLNNLTPPVIPKEEYSNDYINNVISFYKQQGYEIEIRDFSLGLGFPVVCLIVRNIYNNKYTISVGSHPILSIAIERCFTELRLERDPYLNPKFLQDIKDSNFVNSDKQVEINAFFTIGEISFTEKFFNGVPDWIYNNEFWENEKNSNELLLKNLIKKSLKVAKDIFIRDVSFLGFPAFEIIAPGVSEIYYDLEFLKFCKKMKNVNDKLYKIICSDNPDLELIKELYEIFSMINIRFNNFEINDYLIIISLGLMLNKYDDVNKYLDAMIQKDNCEIAHIIKKYMLNTGDILTEEEEKIFSALKSKNILQALFKIKILKYFPSPKKVPDEIINNLRNAYKKSPPSQRKLLNYLRKLV